MIITRELSKAAVEVNALLECLSQEVLDKIPKKFQDYLKEIEAYDYYFEYDASKPLEEQGFSEEALKMIGQIYKDYLCNEEQREKYINHLKEYNLKVENEKREKYNPDELFKNKMT